MMEVRTQYEGADSPEVLALIGHACIAGGLSALIRRQPEHAIGLGRAYDFHSGRAATLAAVIDEQIEDDGAVLEMIQAAVATSSARIGQ